MARVAPDANDVFVLLFNESSPGTHVNTGTAGASGNFLDYGSPISGAQGLVANNALYLPSQYISSNHDGAGGANDVLVTPNLSMSGWMYMRRTTNFFAELWSKQYTANTWSAPFLSFGIQLDNNNGGWSFFITTAGTLRQFGSVTVFPVTSGRWYHIGGTWDGTTLTCYLNGNLVGTLVPGGGAIDYNTTNRGQWFTGSVPGSSTNQGSPCIVQDLRIANVVRSQPYFANIYYQGIFVNG